jgi:cytochrome c
MRRLISPIAVFIGAFLTGAFSVASAQDAVKGEKVFAACAACHDPGQANKQGPGLGGIVGRKSATAPGFRYSGAMKRARLVWTRAQLDSYLADPQGLIPGNAMPYPGLPDARQRSDLLAYLSTLKALGP